MMAALNEPAADCSVALTIAYRGTNFHGFQRQEGLSTVQGELEAALATVFRHPIMTVGAGRTDTGVHAAGQVVSFALTAAELEERKPAALLKSLNALTADDLVIRNIEQKPLDFSARFSALEREYRYRIVGHSVPPLFLRDFVWWVPGEILDIQRMRLAVPALVGEHDFKSFCVAESSVDKNTVRCINNIHVFGTDHLGEHCLVLQIMGNAFLHSMVRIIVGSLIEVAQRRKPIDWLEEVLEARDRRAAGPTAPAQGLTLWRVRY